MCQSRRAEEEVWVSIWPSWIVLEDVVCFISFPLKCRGSVNPLRQTAAPYSKVTKGSHSLLFSQLYCGEKPTHLTHWLVSNDNANSCGQCVVHSSVTPEFIVYQQQTWPMIAQFGNYLFFPLQSENSIISELSAATARQGWSKYDTKLCCVVQLVWGMMFDILPRCGCRIYILLMVFFFFRGYFCCVYVYWLWWNEWWWF